MYSDVPAYQRARATSSQIDLTASKQALLSGLRKLGIKNAKVLDAIANCPREQFLDQALSHRAYEDTALPIGHQQTLSRPYTVARMSELLLDTGRFNKVLEIGTGSGYQTAILAQFVPRVYTIERIGPLLERAQSRMRKLGISNVVYRHDDGSLGWPEREPFDAIIVTAAPDSVPKTLKNQLSEAGGCMIIPVGGGQQELIKIMRTGAHFQHEVIERAKFVPLLGGVI